MIGEPTFGIGNTTAFFELSNGSGLQITTSIAVQQDDILYPERCTPDLLVADELEAQTNGHDLILEKALEWLSR